MSLTPPLLFSSLVGFEPRLASLDYDVTDTGGGDAITITGSNLAGAISCTQGGTACAITSNTDTSLTFTSVAKVAGSYPVVVTTAAGASNALALESWDPTLIPSIDGYFDSRKGLVVDGGLNVLSWTEQSRAEVYAAGVAPHAPLKVNNIFAGTKPAVRYAQPGGLTNAQWVLGTSRLLPAGSSFFFVGKWTSADAASSYPGNAPLTVIGGTGPTSNSMFGASADSLYMTQIDGVWMVTQRGSGLNDDVTRLCGSTHALADGVIKIYVGTTQQGADNTVPYTPAGTRWNLIGAGAYDATNGDDGFVGDLGATVIVDAVISGANMTKLHTWAGAGFGAA